MIYLPPLRPTVAANVSPTTSNSSQSSSSSDSATAACTTVQQAFELKLVDGNLAYQFIPKQQGLHGTVEMFYDGLQPDVEPYSDAILKVPAYKAVTNGGTWVRDARITRIIISADGLTSWGLCLPKP